jgi:hypothetical protein
MAALHTPAGTSEGQSGSVSETLELMAKNRMNKFIRQLIQTSFDFHLSYSDIPDGSKLTSVVFFFSHDFLTSTSVNILWETIVLAKYHALTKKVYDADHLHKQIRNLVWNTRRKNERAAAPTPNSMAEIMSHFHLGDRLASFLAVNRLPPSLLGTPFFSTYFGIAALTM